MLYLFLILASFVASEAAAESEWAQFRGGPTQQGIAEALPADLAPAWTFEIADGVESTAAIAATPAGDLVFVAGLDGTLYALTLDGGSVKWKYETGDEIKSSPLVFDGSVYFGDELGRFHAVDAATGKPRWTIEVDASVTGSANLSPAGCLLFGSYDNFLYCVSPADGKVRWKVETEGYVHGTPAVADGKAVSSGCDGYLRIVDAADGAEIKKVELGGYVAASPAVRDGITYVGTFESEVLAIDLESGEIAWTYKHPKRQFPFYASPAVTAERVIVGGRDKMIHALDAKTGEALWTYSSTARFDSSPVVSGDRVFVADQAGELLALALADGEVQWSFESGDSFTASPAIARGRLVISTESGTVYCFAPTAELAR
ncbi:MAG: PQQ-binding-like beta-propeller repeat protein [Thermoanaerobaculia bacterium]